MRVKTVLRAIAIKQ